MSQSSPSSTSVETGGNASSSAHGPAPNTPGDDTPSANRGLTSNTIAGLFTRQRLARLHRQCGDSGRPSHWRPFAALAGGVLNTRSVCLEGATLTSKQVHDYMRTSKVMARTPVTGRKTEWYIASTLEILGVLSSRTIRKLCKHLRQVVAPIQVDGEDHCGRSVQHRTAL